MRNCLRKPQKTLKNKLLNKYIFYMFKTYAIFMYVFILLCYLKVKTEKL